MSKYQDIQKVVINADDILMGVLHERDRQIKVKGHTAELDDRYRKRELLRAAAAFLSFELTNRDKGFVFVPKEWPWHPATFKPAADLSPEDYRRNLEKAGALILAELERHSREQKRSEDLKACSRYYRKDELGSFDFPFPFNTVVSGKIKGAFTFTTPTEEQQKLKDMFSVSLSKVSDEDLIRAIEDVAKHDSAAKAFHELSKSEKAALPTREELNSTQAGATNRPQSRSACSTAIEAMNRALAFIEYQKEGLSSARVFVPGTPRVKNQLKEAIGGLEKLVKTGQAAIDEPDQSSDAPGLPPVDICTPTMTVEQFNKRYPVGTAVRIDGSSEDVTTHRAFIFGGMPAISTRRFDMVLLKHITPIVKE